MPLGSKYEHDLMTDKKNMSGRPEMGGTLTVWGKMKLNAMLQEMNGPKAIYPAMRDYCFKAIGNAVSFAK